MYNATLSPLLEPLPPFHFLWNAWVQEFLLAKSLICSSKLRKRGRETIGARGGERRRSYAFNSLGLTTRDTRSQLAVASFGTWRPSSASSANGGPIRVLRAHYSFWATRSPCEPRQAPRTDDSPWEAMPRLSCILISPRTYC